MTESWLARGRWRVILRPVPVGFRASLVQSLGFGVIGLGALAMTLGLRIFPLAELGDLMVLVGACALALSILTAKLVLRASPDTADVLSWSLIAFPVAGALTAPATAALFGLLSGQLAEAVSLYPFIALVGGVHVGLPLGLAFGVVFLVPLLAMASFKRRPSRVGAMRAVALCGVWLTLIGIGTLWSTQGMWGVGVTGLAVIAGLGVLGMSMARLHASRTWLGAVQRGEIEAWAIYSVLDIDTPRNLAWWERGADDTPRAVLCRIEESEARSPYRANDTLVHPTARLP